MQGSLICENCSVQTDVLAITGRFQKGICMDCLDSTHKGFTSQLQKLVIA